MSGEILRELRAVLEPYSIPAHTANRIIALIAGVEPVYIGGKTTTGEGRSTNGEAVIFTSSVVIFATWRNHYTFENTSWTESTGDATVWARSSLRSASIYSGGDNSHNVDKAWVQASAGAWPYYGRLKLDYCQAGRGFELPMAENSESQNAKFHGFIPSLLDDLR